MTIAICEDEVYFATHLHHMLQQYLQEKKLHATIFIYSSGEALLCFGVTPDIILMDIKLSGKNGMDIIKQLRELGYYGQVIFIMAYSNYVFQAFDVDAVQYLEKPLNQVQFYSAMNKAYQRAVSDNEKTILLTNQSIVSKVRIRDIIYCEVFDHQTIIHTLTNQYHYSGPLDALEQELDHHFFRCHRSYLVNLDYVVKKDSTMTVLVGGDKVFISRRKQQEFMVRLLESCRGGNRT